MNLENQQMLEAAADHLGPLLEEVVFLGGATVELWITDEAAPEFRPTADVDVIVEITTKREYYRFEKRILSLGFHNDTAGGVLCRFKHPASGLLLDVMPTEASILGFENRWQAEAFSHAVTRSLPSKQEIRAIAPPFLVATKLEAFSTRGKLDFFGSRDFADVVALVDGREELVDDFASAPELVRDYVGTRLEKLSRHRDFDRGLEAALPASPESRGRVDLVIWPRIRELLAVG
jgi:hypothetical protein